ncbi:LigA protein [Kutzneria sp. 744]|nr:LigA protein [Kutzneria sp. 744]
MASRGRTRQRDPVGDPRGGGGTSGRRLRAVGVLWRLALDAGAPDRAELLLDLARVQYLAGHIGQSAQTCEQAAEDGERTGRGEVVGRAAIIVQGVGHPEVNRRLEDLCRRALRLLGADAPAALRARVEAQLACVLFELEENDEASRRSRSALELAMASGDPNAELDAIRARAGVEWRPRFNEEMGALGRRAIELAEPAGRPMARLWAHIWLSDAAVHRADPAGVAREVGAMSALADRTGLPLVRWHVLRRQASLAALYGDFAANRRLRVQAADVAADWADRSVQFTELAQSIGLALLRGDPTDLAPGWADHLAEMRSYPPVAQAALASAVLLAGRRDEALALAGPLVHAVSTLSRGLASAALAYLPGLAVEFGDQAGCRAVREVLSGLCDESDVMGAGTVSYEGSAARMLGELDLGCDEPAAPCGISRRVRIDAQLGAAPYVALGRLGLARALELTGDRRRAVELARAAAADARRLDMPGLRRAADAFLASAGANAENPLTPREQEITDLVAQALTNRAIADLLVLSERTVESHVRRILAKTGLSTRTELARWFLQQR